MRRFPRTIAAALVFILSFFLENSPIARAAATSADAPTPTSVTTVGNMRVESYGSGSPALVFIPGIACGSWEWDEAVRIYQKRHAVYIVTLMGFDGLPPTPSPSLDRVDASLFQLVSSLDRPVVIGHSFGGFIALRFGTEHAKLVRGIVTIDGTPVYPSLAESTPQERIGFAAHVGAQLASLDAAGFAAGQHSTIATMVSDPAQVDRVASLTARSDPATTGAYARDFLGSDIRSQLKNLTAPLLVLAPVPPKPAPFEGSQASLLSQAEREDSYRQYYESLFAGAPKLSVVPIARSLHFATIDQPTAVYSQISSFIDSLPR